MTYRAMADELGVTFYSVSSRVAKMIKSGELVGKSKTWLKEEDDFLLSAYKTVPKEEIADILGTTPSNISDRYFKLNAGIIGLSPKATARMEETQALRNKKVLEQYNKALLKGLEEDRKQGLNFDNLKLNIGQAYKIKQIERNITTTFEGKLIQVCDRHLVFKNKNGRCESFLKADLMIDVKFEEVIR